MAVNIFQQGMDAFDSSYARTDQMLQDQAKMRAGPKVATGDFRGAAQELGGAGMVDEATQAFGNQHKLDTAASDEHKAAAKQRADILTKVAQGLKGVPEGQRAQALQSAAPFFKQAGIDPSPFLQLKEESLSNGSLDTFTGHVQAALHVVSPGGHLVDNTGKPVFDAPFAPQYRSVGEGQSLVEVGPGSPAPAAPQGDPTSLAAPLTAIGAKVTSGVRSTQHNAEVGGVPNSRHLTGNAADLVPPAGMTLAQLGDEARRRMPGAKVIVESDHVHIEAPTQQGGARVIAQGPPKAPKEMARSANAAEKAQYGIPEDVPAQVKPDGSIDVISGVGARNKQVPAKIQEGYIQNNAGIKQIDSAIAALKQNPNAMGAMNLFGDAVRQRTDPGGIKVRAAVANVAAVKIHDLSGAAVTAAETPRLKPFIPMPNDTAVAAIKKLEQLKEQIANNNSQIEVQYGAESGYTPLTGGGKPKPAATAPGGWSVKRVR